MALQYQGLNPASYYNGQYGSRAWLESLDDAKDLGANTIAITPTSFIYDKNSTNIYRTSKTEPDADVAQALIDANANGFKTVLKPHIDLGTGEWRGRLDPPNKTAFFDNYKKYIVDYAKIAQKGGADILVLGTELDHLAHSEHRGEWREIIDAVRKVYKGDLTFASNWDGKAEIWDMVDIIGINPYVKLDTDGNGSVSEYARAFKSPIRDGFLSSQIGGKSPFDFWKGLAEKYKKPVMFTEVGYRSVDRAATDPASFRLNGAKDENEQAQLFEAFFQTFNNQSWVNGAMIWDWSVDRGADEVKSDWGKSFSIEGKRAEAVVDRYYTDEQYDGATTAMKVSMAANGSGVKAVIVVDRNVVGEVYVNNGLNQNNQGFKDYTVNVPTKLLSGGETVEVHFANPAPGRGLHVNSINLQGKTYQMDGEGSKGFLTVYNTRTAPSVDIQGGFSGAVSGPDPLPVSRPAPSQPEPAPAPAPKPAPTPTNKAPAQKNDGPTETVSLSLAANTANGSAKAVVYVDGDKVGTLYVKNTVEQGFKDYNIEVPASKLDGDTDIAVQFVNPAPGRGLHVDAIKVDGKRFEVESGKGGPDKFVTTYNSRNIPEINTGDTPASSNARSSGNSSGSDGGDDIVLSLAANVRGGPAKAAVYLDGEKVGTLTINHTTEQGFRDYKIDVPASKIAGNDHEVSVQFLNPYPGRGLHVDSISVKGKEYDLKGNGNGEDFFTAYNTRTVAEIDTGAGGQVSSASAPSTGSSGGSTSGGSGEMVLSLASTVGAGKAKAIVYVDGQKVGQVYVGNDTEDGFKDYKVKVPANLLRGDGKEVEVQFANPAPGRGLEIDAVTIGDTRYEAEAPWAKSVALTVFNSRAVEIALTGEDGLNVVSGGNGNDRLRGSSSTDDYIDGGRGNDVMSAGGGNDTFAITLDGSRDTILDYNVSQDEIVYEGGTPDNVYGWNVKGGSLATIVDDGEKTEVLVKNLQWWQVDQDFLI